MKFYGKRGEKYREEIWNVQTRLSLRNRAFTSRFCLAIASIVYEISEITHTYAHKRKHDSQRTVHAADAESRFEYDNEYGNTTGYYFTLIADHRSPFT